jgi:hypothetical protein
MAILTPVGGFADIMRKLSGAVATFGVGPNLPIKALREQFLRFPQRIYIAHAVQHARSAIFTCTLAILRGFE